jgi:hypothetical protein
VFLILAVHGLHLDLAQIVGEGPYEAVVWTILLSVVLHGITAGPLASAYGKRANELVRPDPDAVGTDSELRRRRFGLGSTSEPS